MRQHEVKILVAVCTGAPHFNGFLRYFTGAEMWGGREFLILRSDVLERYVVIRSTYDAEWLRATAVNTRVDSTLLEFLPPVRRFIQVAAELTGGRGRIGMLNAKHLTAGEANAIREALPRVEIVDLTDEVNRLRQIKSPFEVDAIRLTGRILAEGMELFERLARPGRLAAEIAGEVDGFLKGKGCFWGRVKYSLNQRPETIIASPDRRLRGDDVILFQFVHSGPHGYWYELSRVYSFADLPKETASRLQTMEVAMREASHLLVPGGTYRQVSETVDRVFRDAQFTVIGKHTYDCHTLGTDENEGDFRTREGEAPDFEFRENMVLGLHPATLLEGGFGFLLCETYLVQPGGGVPLSPMPSFHRKIEA